MFVAKELIEVAIRIEENGQEFYLRAAEKVADEPARLLFYHLADEEEKHCGIFAGFLADAGEFEASEAYPGEHLDYIRAYADHLLFKDPLTEEEALALQDGASAARFAARKEMESILYYQEIRQYFPAARQGLLDKIIQEEQSHFTRLSKLLKTY